MLVSFINSVDQSTILAKLHPLFEPIYDANDTQILYNQSGSNTCGRDGIRETSREMGLASAWQGMGRCVLGQYYFAAVR